MLYSPYAITMTLTCTYKSLFSIQSKIIHPKIGLIASHTSTHTPSTMGWVIGVVLNLLGSVCINGGTNLMVCDEILGV